MRLSLWFAILAMLVLSAATRQVADLDMYHEMALIREALRTGAFPRDDVFAFTPTVSPSVHHEWATGAVLYAVAIATGLGGAGVLILRYLLLVGVVGLTYAASRKRGGTGETMAICAPVAILMFGPGLVTLRAHMFTFLFVALLVYILERDREGDRKWIAVWLPTYVVWLNLHGGFVAGVGLFVTHTLERAWSSFRERRNLREALSSVRHLLVTLVAMGPLALINPYGVDFIPFLWESILLDRPLIEEWAPLWSGAAFGSFRLGFTISLLFVAYTLARGSATVGRLALVIVAGIAAIGAQRIVPIYAIVWFAVMPGLLAATPLRSVATGLTRSRARPAIAALAAVLGIGLTYRSVAARPWELSVPGYEAAGPLYYPVGPVDYLEANGFSGNLMTEFGAGSYVSWHLYPRVRVSMDSRYEVAYRPELVDEMFRFYAAEPGWEAVLDRYPADAVLVRTSRPLYDAMTQRFARTGHHGWSQVYRDDTYAVFVRHAALASLPFVDRRGEQIHGRFP